MEKNQIEKLELKNIITEMKYSLEGLSRIFQLTVKRISEL